jgi:molybdate transport system substrate-binding protein
VISVQRWAAVLGVLTLTACGQSSAEPSGPLGRLSGETTVFAAASLTKVFTELGNQFESEHPGTTVSFSFGASSGLAQQVLAGAPADVYASASQKNMDQVVASGSISDATPFASNVGQIAVTPSAANKVTSLDDLGKPGVKVALCQPAVPCGVLTQEVLQKAAVRIKPVTLGLDVTGTLANVVSGEVDAAIVYVTDVLAAGNKVVGVTVPAAVNASTPYLIGTISTSDNPLLAKAFADFVRAPAGQARLNEAGFSPP